MPRRERENTLPSFAAALAAGAQGIELDVHATADGVVVVHHDAVTSDGVEIAARSLERSEPVPKTVWRDGNPDPGLGCDLVAERAELFVEIKGEGIEEAVTAVLDGRSRQLRDPQLRPRDDRPAGACSGALPARPPVRGGGR